MLTRECKPLRFAVTRTSLHDDGKPCEEAIAGEHDYWDVRTFKSPEEHDARLTKEKWHDRGTDHQLVYGPRGGVEGIKRNLGPRKAWFVEFDSLEALLAFADKYGDVILTHAIGNADVRELEIYDGYRE